MKSAAYPLEGPAPWALNQWYIVRFAQDVGQGVVGRTFLDRRVAQFRDSAGVAHALSGICSHRMMAMEAGSVRDDRLVCGYHGVEFDLTSKCVAAPTASTTPDCALAHYPLIEAGPLLWIWLGDPDVGASTSAPDQALFGIGSPEWRTNCVQRLDLKARLQLLIDNLFDLSHLGFVHASILGAGELALVKPMIEERDGRLVVALTYADAPTNAYHQFLYPRIGTHMTVRIEAEMLGAGLIHARGPAWNGTLTQAPRLGQVNFIYGVTPQNAHSTSYWSNLTRDVRQDDDALSEMLIAQKKAVIDQDVDVLESIEKLLAEDGPLPVEISMSSGAGAIRARLRMIQMIQSEHSSRQVKSVA